MFQLLKNKKGFTLVELLIVIIILGVLAAVAIPQFGSSTEDAQLAALDANLAELRNSVELYYHQHSSTYPGVNSSADNSSPIAVAVCATSIVDQLLRYTTMNDHTAVNTAPANPLGPYIKNNRFPENPFATDPDGIVCDASTDITAATATGVTAGWKFYPATGKLIANTAAHLTR